MRALLRDLRFALRSLSREPLFTVLAVLYLALGLGGNTVVFSLVERALLQALPYPDPGRLVLVWDRYTSPDTGATQRLQVSAPNHLARQAESRAFASLAAFDTRSLVLTGGGGEPEELAGLEASPELLPLLGLQMQIGRGFTDEDAAVDADTRVALLSHGLWQRRFGADTGVLGKTVRLDGEPHTVIGVLAVGSRPPMGDADLWIPLPRLAADDLSSANRQRHNLLSIGRLAPGATLQQAQAELDTIARRLAAAWPDSNEGWGAEVIALREYLVGDLRPRLLAVQIASWLLLLLVCAHLANLLLLRAARSRQELAVRAALGAGRGPLLRRLIADGLILSLGGWLAGSLVAVLILGHPASQAMLSRLLISARARPEIFSSGLSLDLSGLVYGLLLALLTGLVCGALPALRLLRGDLFSSVLRSGGAADHPSRQRLLSALAVVEVALAMMLLVGASLLVKSFANMSRIDLGFDARHMLVIGTTLPDGTEAAWRRAVVARVRERLVALPGVTGVGLTTILPVSNHGLFARFNIKNRPPASEGEMLYARYSLVAPETLSLLGMPLLAGRDVTTADDVQAPGAVVVSRSLAEHYWPDADPLGRELQRSPRPSDSKPWLRVVGVVDDIVFGHVDGGVEPALYFPYDQHADTTRSRLFYLMVRTAGDPADQLDAVRRAIREVDSGLPLTDVRTLSDIVDEAYADRRASTVLIGLCAVLALVLAVVGVYGVLSTFVTRRRREIGIRMSLGARASDIQRQILGRGLVLTVVGLVLGAGGAVLMARALASQLYQVEPLDLGSFLLAGAVLVGVAAVANIVPARRAAGVQPSLALRYE